MGESKTIFGLHYEYIEKNGQYLVVKEKQEQALTEEDLIQLQLRMMQSNQIPNLLPLSVEEIDFELKLYYDVTSKRQLNVYLNQYMLSSHEFYQLFMNIISTLEQSKLYMLNEHQYILQEEFIYLGKTTQQLYLTYAPVQGLEKETTTMDDLKELLGSIAERVDSLQGSELNTIQQYIDNSSFNLSGLKELLLELQQLRPNPYQGGPGFVPGQQNQQGQANGNGYQQQAPKQQGGEQPNHAQNGQESDSPADFDPFRQDPAKKKKASGKKKKTKTTKNKGKGEPLPQRIKIYIGVGAALAIALIWKLFETIPTQAIFYTSIAATVLLIAAAIYFIFFFKVGKAGASQEQDQQDEAAATQEQQAAQMPNQQGYYSYNQPNQQSFNQFPQAAGMNQTQAHYQPPAPARPQPVKQEATAAAPSAVAVATKPESMPSYNDDLQAPIATKVSKKAKPKPVPMAYLEDDQSLMMDTGLLSESDDTVLLGEDSDEEENLEVSNPFLEVEREDGFEQIELAETHFTIGRNDEAVVYVEDSVGVSRVHAEFVRIENSYGVKDLGSKNGTKLNGEALVPYKIYALQIDDVVSIGKVDYTFKWE
ncbi:DUF6382 domain-containing protein [Alkalihalobacillus pseudalcaliphilus]|uniref:DUF6382 domain-containing protein n=1 Tax=Alkalihalobacillus pseudalcaliphilus TaxID=79884 RepID=UPI00064D814D|nr:DUF6382 domain-containing protein [Alkalihalobacillus pseudalcaliphilus]KMK78252.1 hypothetical protein AB990_02110 [Alkalihalobacillus pseudalcaliphilus]